MLNNISLVTGIFRRVLCHPVQRLCDGVNIITLPSQSLRDFSRGTLRLSKSIFQM